MHHIGYLFIMELVLNYIRTMLGPTIFDIMEINLVCLGLDF